MIKTVELNSYSIAQGPLFRSMCTKFFVQFLACTLFYLRSPFLSPKTARIIDGNGLRYYCFIIQLTVSTQFAKKMNNWCLYIDQIIWLCGFFALKGCLGALDGTHIHVLVSNEDKPRYRNRKGQIATNTLAVCDRNMQFVYLLPGCEGSSGDSRILRDAVSRDNGFKVPQGMLDNIVQANFCDVVLKNLWWIWSNMCDYWPCRLLLLVR